MSGGPPEGSMDVSSITLTGHLEPDGTQSVTTKRSEGMSYLEALGMLEFAKMCIFQNFVQEHDE